MRKGNRFLVWRMLGARWWAGVIFGVALVLALVLFGLLAALMILPFGWLVILPAAVLAIAERLQVALADSGWRGQGGLLMFALLGVCTDVAPSDRSGRAMIAALEDAVAQAARDGPSPIRLTAMSSVRDARPGPETA